MTRVHSSAQATEAGSGRRAARDMLARAAVVAALLLPGASSSASNASLASASAAPAAALAPGVASAMYQEISSRIVYGGPWKLRSSSVTRRARLAVLDRGLRDPDLHRDGVQLDRSESATRGQAKIYLDGRYVRTVDTYAADYVHGALLGMSFSIEKARTLKIVVVGTPDDAPSRSMPSWSAGRY